MSFVNLTETEINKMIEGKDAESTKKVLKRGKAVFLEYALSKGANGETVSKMTAEELNEILFSFYPSIRRKDKNYMKLNTLKSLRYGIVDMKLSKLDIRLV